MAAAEEEPAHLWTAAAVAEAAEQGAAFRLAFMHHALLWSTDTIESLVEFEDMFIVFANVSA